MSKGYTREEQFLNAIADGTTPPQPLSGKEEALTNIAKTVKSSIELPLVTTEDNGDVLKVIEGAWGKGKIPTELPEVTSEDNGNVLAVVEGAWAKAQPSGGESPVSIYDICFDDFTYSEDYGYYVGVAYWGKTKVTTNRIVSGTSVFCAELDADMVAGKPIIINVWIGTECIGCLTRCKHNTDAHRYNLENMIGVAFKSDAPYFVDSNGYYYTFHYSKNESSTKDGSFIGERRASLT